MDTFESILKKLNISFGRLQEVNQTSSLATAYILFTDLIEFLDLQSDVAEKLAAHIQLSLVSSDVDLNQKLIDKHIDITKLANTSADEVAAQTGLGLDIIKPIQHRSSVVSEAIREKLEEFEVVTVQQKRGDTGIEQSALSQSAPSLINLLPSLIPPATVNRPPGTYIDISTPAPGSSVPIYREGTFTISGRATKVQEIFIPPGGGYTKPIRFLIQVPLADVPITVRLSGGVVNNPQTQELRTSANQPPNQLNGGYWKATFSVDHAGNAATQISVNQGATVNNATFVFLDRDPPEVSIVAPKVNEIIPILPEPGKAQPDKALIKVTVTAKDRLSGVGEVQASVDDWASFQTLKLNSADSFDWTTWIAVNPNNPGETGFLLKTVEAKGYTLRVRAFDWADSRNVSSEQNIPFRTIDQTKPLVNITSPKENFPPPPKKPTRIVIPYGIPLNIDGTAQDTQSGLASSFTWQLDGASLKTVSPRGWESSPTNEQKWSFEVPEEGSNVFLESGFHTISLCFKDQVGNAESKSISFEVTKPVDLPRRLAEWLQKIFLRFRS